MAPSQLTVRSFPAHEKGIASVTLRGKAWEHKMYLHKLEWGKKGAEHHACSPS